MLLSRLDLSAPNANFNWATSMNLQWLTTRLFNRKGVWKINLSKYKVLSYKDNNPILLYLIPDSTKNALSLLK